MTELMRKVAVVTTFSKAGFKQYANRMIETWKANWPDQVDLFVYPDEKVPIKLAHNVRVIYDEIPEKTAFIEKWRGHRPATGYVTDQYNYRYDAIKFCHKPFALWHAMHKHLNVGSHPYSAMIWLDADTITHRKVPIQKVHKLMAPEKHPIQFLGRSYKYTECGYLYFNLQSANARLLVNKWVDYYRKGIFIDQREWHDSYLFDLARGDFVPGLGKDLTGHIPRRQGGGHPFINCFLGEYMDHHKGDARKATGKPRKNDLFVEHKADYWRQNDHANATKKRRIEAKKGTPLA